MVSNKKYIHALKMWNKWEEQATSLAFDNGRLLKEMKEINDLSKRVNENSMEILAECRRLKERLELVEKERDYYHDLLPDVSEINGPAANAETLREAEAQWDRYYLNV